MRRWQVIIEGEASAKRFLRTLIVGASNADEAEKIARVEFEKEGDRFIELAEVTKEKAEVAEVGLVWISGRIFFG